MAKTAFLQIRVSPEDLERIRRVARKEHLKTSTWARGVLLKAVEKSEAKQEEEADERRAR